MKLSALVVIVAMPLIAQVPEGSYEQREVMIPMRDGVRLHTVIFTPRLTAGPLPIMFGRTPYGALK